MIGEAEGERIVLGRMSTEARLFGRTVDQAGVERRLDEVARGALPDALGAMVYGGLHGQDGIVRIDSIAITFTIDRRALDGGELAERWAAGLGATIADRIQRPHRGVARFASYAHFVAAYLEHRFAVAQHPAFAFADFAPLDHLAPAEAAIELLAARPVFLGELARQGQRRGRAGWLADRLDDSRGAALFERIFGEVPIPPAPELAVFRQMMADAPVGWRGHALERAALAVALSRLAAADRDGIDIVLATLALAELAVVLDRVAREAPEALEQIASGKIGVFVAVEDTLAAAGPASARLRRLLADSAWRDLATAVARSIRPTLARQREKPNTSAGAGKHKRTPPPVLHSPFAGTVLILPALRSLSLAERLHPDQLRALIVAAIGPAETMQDAADALAAFLVPRHDPDPAPPWPALPDGEEAEPGAESWAAVLLRAFAERLPGLQASTPAYLGRQFLHGRGELTLEDKALVARLARPALAIVLTMSGMIGDQGALPWLEDRRLSIEFT